MKWNPFTQSYTPAEKVSLEYLKRCKLFSGLTDRQLYYFLPYMFERRYRINEAVFFVNDPSQALYIVKSGLVSLNLDMNEKFEEVGVMKAHDFFGENSLLAQSRRIYTAISITENTSLHILPKVHIREIFADHPKIKAKMMETLCEVINERNENIYKEYKNSMGFFELGRVFVLKETEKL